jgi:hypothetical protein
MLVKDEHSSLFHRNINRKDFFSFETGFNLVTDAKKLECFTLATFSFR